jgi:hypothetical protein
MATGIQVVIDCADPARLAAFWAAALGYTPQPPPAGFASWQEFLEARGVPESEWNSANAVVDPDQRGPRIFFQRVPEPKTVKNRVHLDLHVGADRREAEVARLTGLGAKTLWEGAVGGRWTTMADPEGNEFCVA